MKLIIIILSGLILCGIGCEKENHTNLNSSQAWIDTDGNKINAHGGGILKFGEKYYWFGTYHVARSMKEKIPEGVNCYSSDNLKNWKYEGLVFQTVEDAQSPITIGCIVERPKVIYNKSTGKFVMWFHHELKGKGYRSALTGLAISDNITGPFKYVKSVRPNAGVWPLNYPDSLKKPFDTGIGALKKDSQRKNELIAKGYYLHRDFKTGQMSRDMTLFVDTDDKAYHIHASEDNQTLHISELTDDYTGFTGKYVRILPSEANEAPAIIKKGNRYYIISSGCTGWDPNPARSATATDIMGNWVNTGNPIVGSSEQLATTFGAQGTYILKMDNGYILMADRWNPSEISESDYLWLSLQFNNRKPELSLKK
jgi:beta-xylosidase